VEIERGELAAGGDVGKSYPSVHDRQLSRVIELEARDPLSAGKDSGLGQFPHLPTVDKGLQNILLDIVVVVDDL